MNEDLSILSWNVRPPMVDREGKRHPCRIPSVSARVHSPPSSSSSSFPPPELSSATTATVTMVVPTGSLDAPNASQISEDIFPFFMPN